MANVEVKQVKPTYTLTLDEDEFWTVMVALGDIDDVRVQEIAPHTYQEVPEDFTARSYDLWRLMAQTVGEP